MFGHLGTPDVDVVTDVLHFPQAGLKCRQLPRNLAVAVGQGHEAIVDFLKELQKQEIVNEDGETVNYYDTKVWDEISANEELILDTMTCAG